MLNGGAVELMRLVFLRMVEKWIQNMKRLENVLSEIEATSIRAAELIRK